MTFNFWSLDYFYYPVSGIMWVWHKVFGSFLGYNNAWAWVLSVVFLVFTLRSLLFKPFLKQMDSQLKMQAVQPEMKKLREKYKDDRQRLTEETMRLNKEAGVNPLASCLPALVQAPVFLALYHVLRSFKENAQHVYFFGASDVQSFVDARLFGGAPLSSYIRMPDVSTPTQVGLIELNGVRSTVIAVAIPLTILAAVATHLTSRKSIARQREMNVATTGQTAIMNSLMLYIFPLGVLVGGIFFTFPIANLFYWLSNNVWTLGQLAYAHRAQDRKKAAELTVVEQARDATKFTKPPPGARPNRAAGTRPLVKPVDRVVADSAPQDSPPPVDTPPKSRRGGSAPAGGNGRGRGPRDSDGSVVDGAVVDAAATNGAVTNGVVTNGAVTNSAVTNGAVTNGAASGTTANGAPKPGVRPSNQAGQTRKKKPRR